MSTANTDESESLVAADVVLIPFSDFASTTFQKRFDLREWPRHSAPVGVAYQVRLIEACVHYILRAAAVLFCEKNKDR